MNLQPKLQLPLSRAANVRCDSTGDDEEISSHPLRNSETIKSNYEERFERRPF